MRQPTIISPGRALKAAREGAGAEFDRVAEIARIKPGVLIDIEANRREPTESEAARIGAAIAAIACIDRGQKVLENLDRDRKTITGRLRQQLADAQAEIRGLRAAGVGS